MADDINPATAAWSETNMKPNAGEDGDVAWARKLGDNDGFLKWIEALTAKGKIIWGTHFNSDVGLAGAKTLTINFNGTGDTTKVNGYDPFMQTSYWAIAHASSSGPSIDGIVKPSNRQTTSMDIEITTTQDNESVTIEWIAIGW